jgi:LuxR family transcriptional regulator, maltose regulon positive regulatory protein
VVHVSAPAGSGKTALLRSWITEAGLTEQSAWVSVGREERDPQAFWLAVLDSLRGTRAGSAVVRELTAAPDLEGRTIVNRLLEDLSSLGEPTWLVIDDLHELDAGGAVEQLELLLRGAPAGLRFVLLTRRDLRLGLHRLRVEGELTEIRGENLLFTFDESRALLEAAGVRLSDRALQSLLDATEGWAAGLRLAALSMAGHPDPEQFAASFSGRERTVAEYLLAEVLQRQPEEVSRLLLRTSVLDRVSGPLADRLTGDSGSERILIELEDAGAFVVALDRERSWFRYHRLFADLLALELRRTAPAELPGLHTTAAEWFAEHDGPVEAIRHAQAADNWGLATRLLVDNWRRMHYDGMFATSCQLLSGFPPDLIAANAELAVLAGYDRLAAGSLHEAERYLTLAARISASVPEHRRARFEVSLAIGRRSLARGRNDLEAVAEEAQRVLALTEAPEAIEFGLGEDVRTSALSDVGIAEIWAGRLGDAELHLEQALAEARRIGRPFLELQALAHLGLLLVVRSGAMAEERARQAIELARRHGWEETAPSAATACIALGNVALWRGQLQEAEAWLDRAERVLGYFAQPAVALMLYVARALLEFTRGRHAQAIAAYDDVESMAGMLVMPHMLATIAQAAKLRLLLQMGETERVQQAFAEMNEERREGPVMQVMLAALRLAEDDADGAGAALAPIIDGSTLIENPRLVIQAFLLEAMVRDALGDPGATSRALERALDVAEPDGLLFPFLLYPAPALLERHSRLRTNHASLISEILNLLSGRAAAARLEDADPLPDPLSDSELRVLRYLPTNLQAPEIATELFVSINTIRTHMRHLYAKLDVHNRADAVERARALGLLSPSAPKR